jgi:periplasmic protein TonB
MGADEIAQAARRRQAAAKRILAARRAQERRFWIGVGCAAVLHAALFVGVNMSSSSPRQLGDEKASPDGISVDIVDAADLASKEIVSLPVDNPPASTPPPQPPQPEQPQPNQPPAQEPAAAPPPAPKNANAIEKAQEQPPTPEPPKKQPTKAPPTKTAALQQPNDPLELSLPDSALAPAGRSTAFARPANITRSGENDEFGRGVVRALRRTMPESRELDRRTTIRLFLSQTGNIVEARLIRSSGDPILDQNVLFSARQASFPIPPAGATEADRTFVVTYVYKGY